MSDPGSAPCDRLEAIPDHWVEAGSYATLGEAEDRGLVVLAMGLDYGMEPLADGYRLLVEPKNVLAVREQLDLFDRENIRWPPPPLPVDATPVRGRHLALLLWMIANVLVFGLQQEHPGRFEASGALDPRRLIEHGEWWRPFTALFLHGGIGHLVANLCSGYFVFAVVLSYLGRARGWALLLAAGVGGNVLAAALRYGEPYRSIGASTAVFGGLGLLTGRALLAALRMEDGRRWRNVFVPLAAGVVLLGLFGAGDAGTDVVAHATGFVSGVGVGAAFSSARPSDRGN